MPPTHDEIEPELSEVMAAVESVQRQVDGLAAEMRESRAENKRKFEQILALLDKTPMMQPRQQPMSMGQYDAEGRFFVPETPGMSSSTPAHGRRHTPKLTITHGTNLPDPWSDTVAPQFAHMSADERAARGKELREREEELRAGRPSPISLGSLSTGASSSTAARQDLAKLVAAVIPFPELK